MGVAFAICSPFAPIGQHVADVRPAMLALGCNPHEPRDGITGKSGSVRKGVHPMKWEYKVVFLAENKGYAVLAPKLENELNKLGVDGWEFVGITGNSMVAAHTVVLKRPSH
jgi:Domain of unknown function (DUF4177)